MTDRPKLRFSVHFCFELNAIAELRKDIRAVEAA